MRIFAIEGDQFAELGELPAELPPTGYLWVSSARSAFERQLGDIQAALQRWTGSQLVDLHVSDLLNKQLPSNYDYTSWYDLMVFRRLAPSTATERILVDDAIAAADPGRAAPAVDTDPVGFAVFDRVLLTVHPEDCQVRDFFANRLQNQIATSDLRSSVRMPTSPADLMLRMVNHIVDSYLALRRQLTRQLEFLQQELFNPRSGFTDWRVLLDSRNIMHFLEDTCEDQRSAVVEWIDALDEWPVPADPAGQRDRELLRVRSRDVLEHIERVLSHVRRLESLAEGAVQLHFSAQSNRTNDIMRALTVLTAIFLPLNLVTGFFGMNFEGLPLIHSPRGFWITAAFMLVLGISLSTYFWRKRYLGRHGGR